MTDPPVLSVLLGFLVVGLLVAGACLVWLVFGPTPRRDDWRW